MLDLDGHLARHHIEQLAELAGDVVGNLLRLLDEVEVPAARMADAVSRARRSRRDAEGRRTDAGRPQVGGEGGQRGRIGDADVGQPIGQQQGAVDALGGGMLI
jgi:hypothetical protein